MGGTIEVPVSRAKLGFLNFYVAVTAPIVVMLVVTSLLDLLGDEGILPGAPEAWALFYALVPLTFAWVLTRGELVAGGSRGQ